MSKSVRVLVRVRPMLPREVHFDSAVEVTGEVRMVWVIRRPRTRPGAARAATVRRPSVPPCLPALPASQNDGVLVFKSNAEFSSKYNHVFSEHAQQQEVYEQVKGARRCGGGRLTVCALAAPRVLVCSRHLRPSVPAGGVLSAMQGFNNTIFAYGQVGVWHGVATCHTSLCEVAWFLAAH